VKEKYTEYYDAIADRILPFLAGRKVACKQFFDGQEIFRRHYDGRRWIYIRDAQDLHRWAEWHTWAFFPHLKAEGPGVWFVLDIDRRTLPLKLAAHAALTCVDILEEKDITYLLKYSGNDGFHILWNFTSTGRALGGVPIWDFQEKVVDRLRDEVEARLKGSRKAQEFRKLLEPDEPFIVTNAQEREHRNCLLFDKLILKNKAQIRAPFSLHEKSLLVSLPLSKEALPSFDPQEATMHRAMDFHRRVGIPNNDIQRVKSLF
jgi:DNA primase